jgi:hypothetical protein
MHANSVRAGYLDLNGCTVVDLLPRSVLLYRGSDLYWKPYYFVHCHKTITECLAVLSFPHVQNARPPTPHPALFQYEENPACQYAENVTAQ